MLYLPAAKIANFNKAKRHNHVESFNSVNCRVGPVAPFPRTCEGSIPPPGGQPEELCSFYNQCPVGYSCCNTNPGRADNRRVCRK